MCLSVREYVRSTYRDVRRVIIGRLTINVHIKCLCQTLATICVQWLSHSPFIATIRVAGMQSNNINVKLMC